MHRVHVEAGVPVLSHFFHDLVPYLDCCLLSANCDKYYEKRPSDNGSRHRPITEGNKATFTIMIMVITMTIIMMVQLTISLPCENSDPPDCNARRTFGLENTLERCISQSSGHEHVYVHVHVGHVLNMR